MKQLINFTALLIAFGLGLLIVIYTEEMIEYFDPNSNEEAIAILAKAIGAFVGGLLIAFIARTHEMQLALFFGMGLVVSEIFFVFMMNEATLGVIIFKFLFLFLAYLGCSLGLGIEFLGKKKVV